MTHGDLIAILERHPRCRQEFGWRFSLDAAYTHDGEPIAVGGTPGEVGHHLIARIVGPLVLWCWEHRIEAIHALGTWQAFSMDDGTEALSSVHPEPWLALLDACERFEDAPDA